MSFQKIISFLLSVILFFSSGAGLGKYDLTAARSAADSPYAQEGYRLTEYILKKSYDPIHHVFKENLGDGGTSYIYGPPAP